MGIGFRWVRFWVWFFKKAENIEQHWVRLAKKHFFLKQKGTKRMKGEKVMSDEWRVISFGDTNILRLADVVARRARRETKAE